MSRSESGFGPVVPGIKINGDHLASNVRRKLEVSRVMGRVQRAIVGTTDSEVSESSGIAGTGDFCFRLAEEM